MEGIDAGFDRRIVRSEVFRHDGYLELFAAWTWMATRPGASLLDFSRCFFRQGYPHASGIYRRLSGNEAAFGRLGAYLLENGYTRVCNWNGQVSLDYWKSHDGKAPTKGGFEYGIHHSGISARYDLWAEGPPVFGLCIPRMKEILVGFDGLYAWMARPYRQVLAEAVGRACEPDARAVEHIERALA